MAQFDVHRLKSTSGLIIDCQSDVLDQLNTRFVVPLIARDEAPKPAQRLNPLFMISGREHVMATQFAAAVSVRELGEMIVSLRDRSFDIVGALDILVSGV
jgi:toxin CcdB